MREAWHRRLAPMVTLAAVLAVILDVTLWRWLTMLGRGCRISPTSPGWNTWWTA